MTILIFTFKALIGGRHQDAVMLFAGQQPLDAQDIQQSYQQWAAEHVPPAHTYLLGSTVQLEALLRRGPPQKGSVPGLERLSAWGTLHLCAFDRGGRVVEFDISATAGSPLSADDVSGLAGMAIAEFVRKRVQQGDVVVPAPGGFYFQKLSGRFASHFIRCEALLQSTLHIELLALAILPTFSAWMTRTERQRSHEVLVYIDSMAIWPLAEKLGQMYGRLEDGEASYQIHSFQSYEGLETWSPAPGPAFVILSASTSGSLASAVIGKLRRSVAHVVTVLSLNEAQAASASDVNQDEFTVCFDVPRALTGGAALDGLRPKFEPAVPLLPLGCEAIRLFGERFLAQNARPKLVRIAHSSLRAEDKQNLARWATENALVAARRTHDGRSFWSVSFDFDKLLHACAEGEGAVLKAWLQNYAPPGRIAIIYPSSSGAEAIAATAAAEALANKVQALLVEAHPGADIPILPSQELNSSAAREKYALHERGVIVVAPVIAGGFTFKQISAQLRRLQPKGPRLFLAFFALPDSLSQLNILRNDLTLNADDSVYQFRCKEAYPIGRLGIAAQWDEDRLLLHTLLSDHSAECEPVQRVLEERLDALVRGEGLPPTRTFLPTLSGAALSLTTGFAMWTGSERISGQDKAAAVLLTIAALLEAARDTRTVGNGDTALKSGLFQQALIDPEMFTRFNDGVIQAAILRAAYPSELNYAMSRQASGDMASLLVKWFELAAEPAGEAAAEFLFALYTGKLRLQPDDLQRVLAATSGLQGWLCALGKMVCARLSAVA